MLRIRVGGSIQLCMISVRLMEVFVIGWEYGYVVMNEGERRVGDGCVNHMSRALCWRYVYEIGNSWKICRLVG